MFDFQALAPADTDHRDADLLANLDRLGELQAQVKAAKTRGPIAHQKVCRRVIMEILALELKVAATPAHTPGGRHAKALLAIREADPDKPCGGFAGSASAALARSALYDIMQAGVL